VSNNFKENVLERITKNNSAICLIDHQVGLLVGVHDITVAELKHNVVGLAKAAKILGIPTIASTTAKDDLWGPTFPELVAVLDTKKYPIIDRMTMNAWDDPHFVKAVEAHGPDASLICGRYSSSLCGDSCLLGFGRRL
jgi:nicotinamidase-related amidase